MSVGGTGKLPSHKAKTGGLSGASATGKTAPKGGTTAVAPDDAVKRTSEGIDLFDDITAMRLMRPRQAADDSR
jgi:hypothetical protein